MSATLFVSSLLVFILSRASELLNVSETPLFNWIVFTSLIETASVLECCACNTNACVTVRVSVKSLECPTSSTSVTDAPSVNVLLYEAPVAILSDNETESVKSLILKNL